MIECSDLRLTKKPLNNEVGCLHALGFGTLIPDCYDENCARNPGRWIPTLRLRGAMTGNLK
jgi:hypothetical protein